MDEQLLYIAYITMWVFILCPIWLPILIIIKAIV